MKKLLRIALLALASVSVIVFYGCKMKEGPEDRESAAEKITEKMAGYGHEKESHESPEEHEGEAEEAEEGEPGMEAQHEAMRTISGEWTKARSAALTGNAGEAVEPAKNVAETAGHIDEFMLHRNRDDRQDFLARSHEFKSLIMRFTAYAEKGDTTALREIAPKIDSACGECHNAFR